MNARMGAALALALCLVVGCSAKNPGGDTSGSAQSAPDFTTLDSNRDGTVTPDEAQAFADLAAVFGQADTNHDGRLSEDEYTVAVHNLI
jgi:EF hand